MKTYHGLSKKIANALLLFPVLLSLGCANLNLEETLFTEEKYVLIDAPVTPESIVLGGTDVTAYTIPEKRSIRKIRIFGEGRITGLRIYVRQHKGFTGSNHWKLVKQINRKAIFPLDVSITAHTDGVAIFKTLASIPSQTGRVLSGHIHKVEFYTVSSGD